MIPLIAGAALAGAGIIGGIASGSTSASKGPTRQPDRANYDYKYTPEYNWAAADADYQRQQATQGGLMDAAARARAEAERARTGPSLAQLQMAEGQSRAAADAAQVAANARGGPGAVAIAQRQAQAQQLEGQASLARSTGQLRAQEEATDRQLRQADYNRELAALQASGALAGQMRQGSQGQTSTEVDARMQAARYGQEGSMAYDQAAQQFDQAKAAADEANRQRKAKFWGSLVNTGTGVATMGLGGGGGGGKLCPAGPTIRPSTTGACAWSTTRAASSSPSRRPAFSRSPPRSTPARRRPLRSLRSCSSPRRCPTPSSPSTGPRSALILPSLPRQRTPPRPLRRGLPRATRSCPPPRW